MAKPLIWLAGGRALILTADLIDRGITIVMVDPVMAGIGGHVDINRNNETRCYIEPWARIAVRARSIYSQLGSWPVNFRAK